MNTATHPHASSHPAKSATDNSAISAAVGKLISELSDTPSHHLTPETHLVDIGLDSLDFVELIVEMEKKWNLSITDNQMERIKTVGDAIVYVQTYS